MTASVSSWMSTQKLSVRDNNAQMHTCRRCRNISIGPSSREVTAEAHRAAEESTHGFVTDDGGAGSDAEVASDSGRASRWAGLADDRAGTVPAAGVDRVGVPRPTRKLTAAAEDGCLRAPAAGPDIRLLPSPSLEFEACRLAALKSLPAATAGQAA